MVLAMLRAFPGARLHTSLYDPGGTFSEFRRYHVETMPINGVAPLRRHHRAALPLLAPAFSSHRVEADVVLCSSSGWAHGVRSSGRKVVYCHTPARWLYQSDRYFGNASGSLVRKAAIKTLQLPLARWDRHAAASASQYLANSRVVRDRIRVVYGLEARVVPPPVDIDTAAPQTPAQGIEPSFLLCVSRLLPYKNVAAVIDAMKVMPGERLVVAGSGPMEASLRQMAGPNVHILGVVDDAVLRWLYANCAAVIAASHEDFGLVPIEAALFGKPTAALRWGGFLDTVIDGGTGTFFDQPVSEQIADAVTRLLQGVPSPHTLKDHAGQFSYEAFARRMVAAVEGESASGSRGVLDAGLTAVDTS